MGKFIRFKTMSDEAWFYYNSGNVLDTLRVVFVSECNNENEDPSGAWQRFSDEAKNNRITAIAVALTDISLDEVEFENPEACRLQDDIMNIYDLLMAMHEHPEARLAHLMSRYADGITSLDSDSDLGEHITEEMVLKTFAHFITEDILDIEAELYARGQEKATSVEASDKHAKDVKLFIYDQYNTITFKTIDPEAWFWADKSNVADSLRVMFEDEITVSEGLTKSWADMDPDTKDARMRATNDALHEIAITEVVFANPADYSEWGVGASSLYELFEFLDNHPDARLTGVYSGNKYFCSPSIRVRELLIHFAEDIAETIIDIEHCGCEDSTDDSMEEKPLKLDSAIARGERICCSDDKVVCAAKKARKRIADELSLDEYNYIDNDVSIIREISDNDPVNHPKHYQASNGLEAIDCIEAFVEDLPGYIGYLIGNAMKYLCRFDKKGKPVEDLHKAKWYIERAIKNIESRKM